MDILPAGGVPISTMIAAFERKTAVNTAARIYWGICLKKGKWGIREVVLFIPRSLSWSFTLMMGPPDSIYGLLILALLTD